MFIEYILVLYWLY